MAKVFLDTNYFINAVDRKTEEHILEALKNHGIYLSVLSIHIYCYALKIHLPNLIVSTQTEKFDLIDLTDSIARKALTGPTSDFEDNVQLHSAAEAECDIFLTEDKILLNMKFFGKVRILNAPLF